MTEQPSSVANRSNPPTLLDGIMTTRALRRLSTTPIPEDVLWEILAAGQQGPSGGNIQPWQFLVVRDEATRRGLGEIYSRTYARYEKAMLAVAPPQRPENEASWQRTLAASRHLAQHFGESPAIIAIAMADISMELTDEYGPLDVGTAFASAYPAVQNLILAARHHGVGTALTTVYRIEHDAVRDCLSIPKTHQVIALLPLGYPLGKFGVAKRRPVETVTHWDSWGNKRAR